MLTAVLIFVLVVANVAVFVSILRAQRITTSKCGGCSAPVVDPLTESCPSCGRGYIDVGIAAGSVMRPPTRRFLCLGGVVVVLACLPFLIQLVDSLVYSLRERGEWRYNTTVTLGAESGNPVLGRRVLIQGVQVRTARDEDIIEAWIELKVMDDDVQFGSALRHIVLERDGTSSVPNLSVPFSNDQYETWLGSNAVFRDDVNSDQIKMAAQCLDENLEVAFLGDNWGDVGILNVKTPFRTVRGGTTDEPMPLATWELVVIWGLFAMVMVAALWVVALVILHSTRQSEASK